MSEESGVVLICPPWAKRNPLFTVRKVTCTECPTEVSVSTCNLPDVAAGKARVLCWSCAKKLMDAGEMEIRGTNLPESGRHDPQRKHVPW